MRRRNCGANGWFAMQRLHVKNLRVKKNKVYQNVVAVAAAAAAAADPNKML